MRPGCWTFDCEVSHGTSACTSHSVILARTRAKFAGPPVVPQPLSPPRLRSARSGSSRSKERPPSPSYHHPGLGPAYPPFLPWSRRSRARTLSRRHSRSTQIDPQAWFATRGYPRKAAGGVAGARNPWTAADPPGRHRRFTSQLAVIGYLARISRILFRAFSAAACGVIPSLMTSASAVPQICWEFASAYPGLKAG